jgi:anti-anti-sigma regulatory factor
VDVVATCLGSDDPVVTMTTAVEPGVGHVNCAHLADGKFVQLGGCLGEADLPALRLALLTPLFDECRDIVIDAGEVDEIDDCAVAVLVAATEWAHSAGVRVLLSRSTATFDDTLEALDLADLLPRLSAPLPTPSRLAAVPPQRTSVD